MSMFDKKLIKEFEVLLEEYASIQRVYAEGKALPQEQEALFITATETLFASVEKIEQKIEEMNNELFLLRQAEGKVQQLNALQKEILFLIYQKKNVKKGCEFSESN